MAKKEKNSIRNKNADLVFEAYDDIYKNGTYQGPFGNKFKAYQVEVRNIYREQNQTYKWQKLLASLLKNGRKDFSQLKLFDAGCGNGHDIRKFIDLGAFPQKCHGVDFNPDMVKLAETLSPTETNYQVMDLDNTPYEDNSFDLIFCFNTLSNYEDNDYIKKMTREFLRILKSDGLLYVICAIESQGSTDTGVKELLTRTFSLQELQPLFEGFDLIEKTNASTLDIELREGYGLGFPNGERVDLNLTELLKAIGLLEKNNLNWDSVLAHSALINFVASLGIVQTPFQLLTLKPI